VRRFVETSNKNTLNFFQHKGIIHVPVSAAPGETTKLLSVAQAEDLAIELGAEEVTTTVDENNVDVIEVREGAREACTHACTVCVRTRRHAPYRTRH
jgi:hypothetical protein